MNESKLLTDRELEILYSIPAPQFVPFVIHRAGVQPRSVAQAALLDELPADLLTEVLRWPAPDLQAAREANAARVEAEAVRRLEQHLTTMSGLLASILAELRWQGRDDPMNTVPKPATPKATTQAKGGPLLPTKSA